jgi:hypothetical protein
MREEGLVAQRSRRSGEIAATALFENKLTRLTMRARASSIFGRRYWVPKNSAICTIPFGASLRMSASFCWVTIPLRTP